MAGRGKPNKADEIVGMSFNKGCILVLEKIASKNKASQVLIKCLKCAEDSELYGDGTFSTYTSVLLRGGIPCGCGTAPKTLHRYEVLARRHSAARNTEYLGFIGEYEGAKTYIRQRCIAKGHEWESGTFGTLAFGRSACPECVVYGFSPEDAAYLYIFLAKGEQYNFVGYGITNNPNDRLKKHVKNLRKSGFDLTSLEVFEKSGSSARAIENYLKDNWEIFPQQIEGFLKEASYEENYNDMLYCLKRIR